MLFGGLQHADRHSFFYKHPLLAKYEWYWRLEPEITYFCDIT
jgi:hypothetical protein